MLWFLSRGKRAPPEIYLLAFSWDSHNNQVSPFLLKCVFHNIVQVNLISLVSISKQIKHATYDRKTCTISLHFKVLRKIWQHHSCYREDMIAFWFITSGTSQKENIPQIWTWTSWLFKIGDLKKGNSIFNWLTHKWSWILYCQSHS